MNIWISAILFALGVLLVVKGGDVFVDAATWIARAFGIPSFIIGATIVSLATTLPEMLVSLIAAADGKNEMAVGNAVGSVTANTGLIMGVAMVFMHIVCKRKDYIAQSLMLIAAVGVLLVGCLGGEVKLWCSIVLLVIFVLFMAQNVRNAGANRQPTEKENINGREITLNIAKFLLGAAGIVAGSQLLVNSGSDIAAFFGVPDRIVAVTLVAIGTSLPEFVTTLTAIAKKESSLSIGNIIGANVIDITLIMPLSSLVSGKPLPISTGSATIDIPVCLALVCLALVPMLVREKASRWQGILMMAVYAVYLTVTVVMI